MNTGYTKEEIQAAPPINFSLANATKTDVTFKLYQNDPEFKITTVSEKNIQKIDLNTDLPTIILIHGWSHYSTNPWYQDFITEYFKLKKCNIFCVDWSPASTKTFLVSSANTKPIGAYIAEFIITTKIPTGNIHIISHSLGAHAAGFAGKMLIKQKKGKLRRITALDPAAPTIENRYVSESFRLCSNDANFVDVYHTDAGYFGFAKPIGDVDFYPNFGKDQPGCAEHKIDESANHIRAIRYFRETINDPSFKAYPAELSLTGYEYSLKIDYEGEKAVVGEHIPEDSFGIYFFKTNGQFPFMIKI